MEPDGETAAGESDPEGDALERKSVLRDSLGVSVATGAYGISFGAIAVAGGLNAWQTMALSLLMFSGGSQFGLVGVVASGGSPWAGAATAIMLGARNAFYGLRLSTLLGVRSWRRPLAAQLVIDESSAMSLGRSTIRAGRLGFYATGLGVFVLWNLGTLVGVVGASAMSDPKVLGLDAAAPAAFIALLAPRLRDGEAWAIALVAAMIAVLTTPLVPPGIPVLIAAAFGIAVGAWPRRAPLPIDDDGPKEAH
jgi:predicted branched-subunit amino acid permease